MHEKITKDPTVLVRRVYDEIIVVDSHDSEDVMPQFENIRFRSKFAPQIPASINDMQITNAWSKTWNGKRFSSLIDNTLGVAVFMTKRMTKHLLNAHG